MNASNKRRGLSSSGADADDTGLTGHASIADIVGGSVNRRYRTDC